MNPLARALAAVQASPAMASFILAELGSSTRVWHGKLHHALMLRSIARSDHAPQDRRHLIQATLFHDIVYDATRTDNEEASAAVATHWLAREDATHVVPLILATKHHDLATDPLTRTLLEADLGVLWTSSDRLYAFYAAGIRREYAHVPDAAYRAGRTAVMTRLAHALTPHLDAPRAERMARNIAGELAGLAARA